MINNGLLWFLLMASPINSQNASIDISFVNATTAATPTQTTQTTLNSTNISTSIYIQSTTRSIIQFTPTPLPPVHSCFDCKISGCQNYGTCIGGNCQCPDGFGGLDCIQPVCGSLATTNSLRPILDRNQCQCADGFDGLNCNICVKDDSCRYLPNAPLGASTLCNQSPRVWNEDHMSFCRISNPLLTGFFSEKGSLTISRSLKTKSAFATMWLNSLPQFSCNATACAQSNTNSSTTWACSTGSCSCVKGSKFCGGGVIDFTRLVNHASGTVSMTCDANSTCLLNMEFLNTMFPDGIDLVQCMNGECTNEYHRPQDLNLPTMSPIPALLSISIVAFILIITSLTTMIAIIDRNKRRKVKEPLIEPGITITFNDIGYKIRNQTILRNVTGAVNPGELLAIMGPSGSGKSTCLDILACKNKGGIITGDIRINGKHVNKNVLFSDISGYVDQDDIHLPTMTVKEVLDFSAGLRLPESMTYRQKDDRVADVLELLGLTHVADKRIGDHLQRGISGGEKRRLSIGVELVTNPSILFLDEPTSGLDSFNAFQVMDTLSKLAKNSNRTIIFTIHQPNSTIYSCFDKLLLLSNGSPYYFGHASDAEEYFQTIGLPCPPQYHIADHLLNCTATSANQKQTYQSSYGTPLTDIKCDDLVAQSSISIESFQDMKIIPSSCTTLTQLQRVLGRSMKSFLRNPTLFITHITMSIVLGTLIGLLYYQVDSTLAGIQNRLGSIFFLQSLLAFAGLSAISSLQNDLILFLRERSNGFYGVFPYYLSKILFDLIPLRIIPTLIISTIPYFLIGLSTNPFNYIKFVSTMVLFSMNSGLFCLLIGCLVNDMGTAILISSVIILFKMLFAGILINQFQIPIYLRWIQYLSFFKYAYEACVVNDSTGILVTDTISGMDVTFPATLVLSKFGFQIDAFWFDFGVSGGICLCLLLTIAIVMNFKLKLKK